MRYFIAMCLGGVFVVALTVGLPWMKQKFEMPPDWQLSGGSGHFEPMRSSRTATGSGSGQLLSSTDLELKAAIAAQDQRRSGLSQQEAQIEKKWQDIRSEQAEIEKVQSQIEIELWDKLGDRLASDRSLRARRQNEVISKASAAERRRLIVDTYRSMSAEGLAEVVQDLMKEELPQDAASVLGILEERKAAKVLALLSGPEPEFAARLTAQLRDGSVKLQ